MSSPKSFRLKSIDICLVAGLESLPKTTIFKKMARPSDSSYLRLPLELSGALDHFRFEESTPTIGREYLDVDVVKDILDAENGDVLVRDLAITSELIEDVLSLHY